LGADETALLRRALDGDGEAFSALMDALNPLLLMVAGAILRTTGESAEGVVLDAWAALWEKPDAFDPRRGTLKTYLCLWVRSRALDAARKSLARRNVPLEQAWDVPSRAVSAEDRTIARELFGALREAVDALAEPMRETVVRRYFLDEPPALIARNMGVAPRVVSDRLYQAKQQLKGALRHAGSTGGGRMD